MRNKTKLRPIIARFFETYLKKERNVSENTILSYRDALKLLFEYLIKFESVDKNNLFLEDITKERIQNFLNWLEEERHSSITTRNQRLAAICSFIHFIEYQYPDLSHNFDRILNIPIKKTKEKIIEHLSKEQVKFLFNKIDSSSYKGLRDLSILLLMYDTGARVQEIINLKKNDFNNFNPPSVTLTGKGRKYRTVVVSDATRDILQKYIKNTNFDNIPDNSLFFSLRGKRKLTRQGIQFILNYYVNIAKKDDSSFPNHVHCHMLRHSMAIHLLESGIDIYIIRNRLGHSSVDTTERYARASVQLKERAILGGSIDRTKDDYLPDWNEDSDLIDYLCSIN